MSGMMTSFVLILWVSGMRILLSRMGWLFGASLLIRGIGKFSPGSSGNGGGLFGAVMRLYGLRIGGGRGEVNGLCFRLLFLLPLREVKILSVIRSYV